MTRFYDIDAANARLPELSELLGLLRAQRAELVGLRDRLLAVVPGSAPGADEPSVDAPATPGEPDEARLLRLRMRALVDQMSASVSRIDAWDVTLRDIERGLVDFPALVNGRQVWLCWRLGEEAVGWWHELEAGFGGRRPLAELS